MTPASDSRGRRGGGDPRTVQPDTLVVFADGDGVEYVCAIPRLGHTDREVRAVAYRWACQKIADAEWPVHGELRFVRIGNAP
jgi:hypothetical protein